MGLLGAVANLSAAVVVQGNAVFEEFKGALAEQYVAQQLVAGEPAADPRPLFYWRNEKTGTEVDFLLEDDAIVPMEVKSGMNARSKSLATYRQRFAPPQVVRASLLNLKADGETINIPLYLLPMVPRLLHRGR